MHIEDTDTILVLAARAGDKEAFAALIARHQLLLLSLCRRALADPELAEDAAQEAILHALLGLERLRQPERFGSWLGGIGLNICRRWQRQRSRDIWSWEAMHGGRQELELQDPQPGPDALVEAAEHARHVRRAIAHLPPGQKDAVLLFYLSGLTYAETAALLEIEVGAVKTRLYKARRTLNRRLSEAVESGGLDGRPSRQSPPRAAGTLGGIAAVERFGSMAPANQAGSKEEQAMDGQHAEGELVEMQVVDVRRAPASSELPARYVVMLDELGGSRRLPIWMGEFEGAAIALHLQQVEPPRPLTFTFAANILHASGSHLREIRVSKLVDSTFYAVAVVERFDGTTTVDARPSDALNLAIVTGAPIMVDAAVLDAVAADGGATRDTSDDRLEGAAEIVSDLTSKWVRPA